jgi:hypothetical protein
MRKGGVAGDGVKRAAHEMKKWRRREVLMGLSVLAGKVYGGFDLSFPRKIVFQG